MNLEQYAGCLVRYRGRIAIITGSRSNYEGDRFRLQYVDESNIFEVGGFEEDIIEALPDPASGLLKRKGNEVVFLYDETEYTLASNPYEPCIYIKKDGKIIRTLHNAFNTENLPERFAQDGFLLGIDGREYDLNAFSRVIIAAVACNRTEMDFTFAAVLSRTGTECYEDYKTVPAAAKTEEQLSLNQKPAVMKYCPECGKKNHGGRYCTECGTKLTGSNI